MSDFGTAISENGTFRKAQAKVRQRRTLGNSRSQFQNNRFWNWLICFLKRGRHQGQAGFSPA
jgi:hypothetical protein